MSRPPHLTPPVGPDDHAQGEARAKVTLVEYGDYECPHCGRAYPIVKDIQARAGKTLRFVFRNFPLAEIHPHAVAAAELAEAAALQGKFWEMHDSLFEHQNALDAAHLARYAASLGLDSAKLQAAFAGDAVAMRVRSDFMGGVRSGVNGTPTFFINERRFDGDWTDTGEFLSAIEDEARR